ncbi:alpha/beta-hydrolase [Lophiostoma macrostomum CBS 122681]|uniref:Alpha/beta-hydrolase n=1 Tax=Lophiostoma macrostomum CBS 122681 TaxID=1314788 RepID=A0A6A6SNX1_9PLEO|nr:alpha/beta-hydrolase [Lophiostoma macrostomum CBS 122681]
MSSPPSPGPTSLQITTRDDRTFLMSALQICLKPFRPHLIKPRKELPAGSPELSAHSKAKSKCHITPRQVCGIWIYDMVAKNATATREKPGDETRSGKEEGRRRRIYYFAGGGWQMPPSPEHWKTCAELCIRLPQTTVSIVSYPLAPNSPAKDALPMLEKLYPHLFSPTSTTNPTSPLAGEGEEEEVVFAGDSAGGNIVLALVLHILNTIPSSPAPNKLLVISPAVDLREQPQSTFSTSLPQADQQDPLLGIPFTNSTAANWSRGTDPSSPQVSPLLADVDVLRQTGVRMYGISAGNDVLGPPARRFAEVCQEKGVGGMWLHWEGMMHCFPLAWVYGLSEGKEGLKWILEALRE